MRRKSDALTTATPRLRTVGFPTPTRVIGSAGTFQGGRHAPA